MKDLMIQRKTAAKYLDSLVEINLMHKEKVGTHNYYLNLPLNNHFVTVKERYGHENTV